MTNDILPQTLEEVIVSIPNLIKQFSLSECEIGVDASGDMLRIVSTNQKWNEMDGANEMQIVILETPYA
jgi:hypothetical protein